jgi:inhibitor of cysteine peptidase
MKKFYCFSVLFLILSLILSSCTGIPDGIDEKLARVESIDILVLESFPVQINVLIDGYLPNPCYKITQIEKHREGNTFYVKLMMKDSSLACIQIIQSYQEVVALDVYGLSAGTYYVDVNGIVDTFTLDVDNILPDTEE